MARRSRLQIYLDILSVVKSNVDKPTKIMHEANISWGVLNKILVHMISLGLMREIDASDEWDKRTNRRYELTQKGDNVIKYFGGAKDLLDIDEILLFHW